MPQDSLCYGTEHLRDPMIYSLYMYLRHNCLLGPLIGLQPSLTQLHQRLRNRVRISGSQTAGRELDYGVIYEGINHEGEQQGGG
jgi:hypothetical protein